jgi:hypothetical protein
MECKSLFEMLYLLSIFKNNDQYKYTLQCLKLCWTGAQHPVETWVVHRQSSVLLERLPCSHSTRNRIMHAILYLLSIQISVRLQHQMYMLPESWNIFHPNMGKFEAPDSSCIILKLNKKICSIPFNKINESQMEIFPWFSYWVNVLCYISSLLNIL